MGSFTSKVPSSSDAGSLELKSNPECAKSPEMLPVQDQSQEQVAIYSEQHAAHLSAMQKKTNELEEMQFARTFALFQPVKGTAVPWVHRCGTDLKETRQKLIQCYAEYPQEPLQCQETAKKYQDLVFDEHYKTIKEHKGIE